MGLMKLGEWINVCSVEKQLGVKKTHLDLVAVVYFKYSGASGNNAAGSGPAAVSNYRRLVVAYISQD